MGADLQCPLHRRRTIAAGKRPWCHTGAGPWNPDEALGLSRNLVALGWREEGGEKDGAGGGGRVDGEKVGPV